MNPFSPSLRKNLLKPRIKCSATTPREHPTTLNRTLHRLCIWGEEDSHNPCGRLAAAQTGSRKCKHRDADYGNGMNIVLCAIPAEGRSRTALRPSVPRVLSPHECPAGIPALVRQAFFNLVFNWNSSSLDSLHFHNSAVPLPSSCMRTPVPLCHCTVTR